MYRQRNFFNRWKTNSVRGSPQHSSKKYSSSGASSLSSALNRPIAVSSAGFRNPRINSSIPVNNRSTPADSIPSGPSSRFSNVASVSKVAYHQRTSSGSHESDKKLLKRVVSNEYSAAATASERKVPRTSSVDSSVQTDDELLENLFTGLWKRSSRSNSLKNNEILSENLNLNTKDIQIYHEESLDVNRYHIQTSKCNSESEFLLDSSKVCGYSLEGNFLRVEEHSPLMAGNERSPLLDIEKQCVCDSTSEETLSDRDEPSDDIDDLLSGVHVHDGSFASLYSSELVLPTLNSALPCTHINGANKPHRLSVDYITKKRSPRPSDASSTCGYQPLSPTATASIEVDPFPISYNRDNSTLGTQLNQRRHLMSLSSFDADGSVPDICIHNHQQRLRTLSCSSSTSSLETNSPKILNIAETTPLHDGAEKAEGEYCARSSIDESPISPLEEVALSHIIQTRSDDFESVVKFQRYLRSRGLELDLSTVKSSDV